MYAGYCNLGFVINYVPMCEKQVRESVESGLYVMWPKKEFSLVLKYIRTPWKIMHGHNKNSLPSLSLKKSWGECCLVRNHSCKLIKLQFEWFRTRLHSPQHKELLSADVMCTRSGAICHEELLFLRYERLVILIVNSYRPPTLESFPILMFSQKLARGQNWEISAGMPDRQEHQVGNI